MGYEPSPLDWDLIRQWGLTYVPNRDLNGYLVWGLADTLDLYPRWVVTNIEPAGVGIWAHCEAEDGQPLPGINVSLYTTRQRIDQRTDDQGNTEFIFGDDQPAQLYMTDYLTPAGPNGNATEIVTGLLPQVGAAVTFQQRLTVSVEPARFGCYYFTWFRDLPDLDPARLVVHPTASPYIVPDWMARDFRDLQSGGVDFVLVDLPFNSSLDMMGDLVSAAQSTGMKLGLMVDYNPDAFVPGAWRDLRDASNFERIGNTICAWLAAVPRDLWVTIQGDRPIITSYSCAFYPPEQFQPLWRSVKAQVLAQFGVVPFILTDAAWGKISQAGGVDGYLNYGDNGPSFTYLGPIQSVNVGYQDTLRPQNPIIPRDLAAFNATLRGATPDTVMMLVTSGDEWYESSGIIETREWGRQYLDALASIKADFLHPQGSDNMQLVSIDFSPKSLAVGQDLTVTAVVLNNTPNPHATQAPNPDFKYDWGKSYKDFHFDEVKGAARLGVDFEERLTPTDYPFRWGGGTQWAANESRTLVTKITMTTVGTFTLFGGVVREQVLWDTKHLNPTKITVSAIVQPTVSFTITPETIQAGQSAVVAWNCQGVQSVTFQDVGVIGVDSRTVSPMEPTAYHIDVTYLDGHIETFTKTLNVIPVQPPADRNPFVWDTPAPWLGFKDGSDFIVRNVYAYDEPKAQGRDVVYVRVEDADGRLLDWQQVDFCNGGVASDWTINGLVNFTMYEGAIFDPNGPNPRGPHTVKCGGAFVDGIGLPVHRHWQYLCVFQKVGASLKEILKPWVNA